MFRLSELCERSRDLPQAVQWAHRTLHLDSKLYGLKHSVVVRDLNHLAALSEALQQPQRVRLLTF